MASISHLHRESAMLSVSDSLSLTCNKYLAGLFAWNNPCTPSPLLPGSLCYTGNSTVSVLDFCTPPADWWCSSSWPAWKYTLISLLRCRECSNCRVKAQPSSRSTSFPISESESLLPCSARVALSQLCSGFYLPHIDYRVRIGAPNSVLCPDCRLQDQTVSHDFSCPANVSLLGHPDQRRRSVALPRWTSHPLTSFPIYHFFHAPLNSCFLGLLFNVGCGKHHHPHFITSRRCIKQAVS